MRDLLKASMRAERVAWESEELRALSASEVMSVMATVETLWRLVQTHVDAQTAAVRSRNDRLYLGGEDNSPPRYSKQPLRVAVVWGKTAVRPVVAGVHRGH
eukprot:729460-Pyramimonas_sp.AAC.1